MSNRYSYSRDKKLSRDFNPYYTPSPNYGYSFSQDDTQNTSEGLYRNTTVGKLVIDALTRYVIGKGLVPISSPEYEILQWDKEQVQKFQRQSEAFYRIITESPSIDFYKKNTLKQLQQIAFKNILIQGDILLHIGYEKDKGVVKPYIQVISGKMVTQNYDSDTSSSVGGVLLDKEGREVGYKIRVIDASLSDSSYTKEVKKYNSLGSLEFDLIQLGQSDPSIIRGIPLLTFVRDDILGLNTYKDNHLTQSAIQSLFTAFVEKEKDSSSGGSSLAKKLMDVADDTSDRSDIKLGAGTMVELEEGEHVNLVRSEPNGENFNEYIKSIVGMIGSACGMSYEVVMNSFNASYSASRASLAGAEKNFQILREEFASKFLYPIWKTIVDYGIRLGEIEAPNWDDGEYIQDAICAVTWTGVNPPQLDPVKEVNAYKMAVENGFCSKEYAIRNLYGMDFGEVEERVEKEVVDGNITSK